MYLLAMDIAERIKIARKEAGLGQRAVANALRLTVAAVSNWESGRNLPNLDAAVAFCELTRVDLEWLVHGRGTIAGGVDKQLQAMPDALREYVLQALHLCQSVNCDSALFLQPPTSETFVEFTRLLQQLSERGRAT